MKNKFLKLNKSVISAILAVLVLLSALPMLGATTLTKTVTILQNGEKIDNVYVGKSTTADVNAVVNFDSVEEYQWQVLADADSKLWVNMSGKNDAALTITYAMVEALLNDSNEAFLRCVATTDAGKIKVKSDKLRVKVIPTMEYEETVDLSDNNTVKPEKKVKPAAPTPITSTTVFHTITVKYLYETEDEHLNNTAAFEPYVATIVEGENFTLNVNCPTIEGFESRVKYEDDSTFTPATVTQKVFNNVTSDHVVLVHYVPSTSKYSVHFFFQNSNNDDYTEDKSLRTTYLGKTLDYTDNNKIVSDYSSKTQGFHAVPTEQLQIAGDGSTELHLYYDRFYYLCFFDLSEGGFGTEAVYAKYNSVVNVKDPKRPGYLFRGWASTKNAATPDIYTEVSSTDYYKMNVPMAPALTQEEIDAGKIAATTYYAVWTTTYADYTVIYWIENADDYDYVYGGSIKAQAMSNTLVSGKDAPKYSSGDEEFDSNLQYFDARSDQNKLVYGDGSTVLNVYYTRKFNKIDFHVDGKNYSGHTHDAVTAETTNNFTNKYTTNGCYMLDCNKSAHVHTPECFVCTLKEHIHTSACCSLPIHAHTSSCPVNNCTHDCATSKICYGISDSTVATNFNKGGEELEYFAKLSGGIQEGYIYRFYDDQTIGNATDKYYLYLGGKWYRYANKPSNTYLGSQVGSKVTRPSSFLVAADDFYKYNAKTKCVHEHNDTCYSCGLIEHDHLHGGCNGSACSIGYEHIHAESCYNCSSTLHVHTKDCYRQVCNKSVNSKSNSIAVYDVKYGSDVTPVWDASTYLWYVTSGGSEFYTAPPTIRGDLTIYGRSSSGNSTIHYYETNTTKSVRPDFKLKRSSGWSFTEVDYIEIPGFTFNKKGNNYYLYYNRNSYTIDYMDGFSNNIHSVKVLYDADITSYMSYVPTTYPDSLEEGAYKFAGWYMDESYSESTKFDPSNPNALKKMPYHDVVLFAKWVPVQHTVKFYTDANFDTLITKDGFGNYTQPGPIDHGGYIQQVPQKLSKEGYLLAGWFYYENGEKKAFDPQNMPINKDINLYPEWQTTAVVDFQINYRLKDTTTDLANPLKGTMLAGNSRMFYAKGEPDWYPDYKADSYFPEYGTHNMIMDTDSSKNVFTFYYTKKSSVNYTVTYVDSVTKERMKDASGNIYPIISRSSDKSIIDFTPDKIAGYLPDSFEKRFYLSSDESQNNFIVEYTQNTKQAYFRVSYLYQNADKPDEYEEKRFIDYLGDIGSDIDLATLKEEGLYEGFSYNEAKSDTTEKVGAEGVKITLVYDRQVCGYTVYHKRLSDTSVDVISPETGTALYGAKKVVNATTKKGYNVSGASQATIQIGLNNSDNVYTFFYDVSQVQINYLRIDKDPVTGKCVQIDSTDATYSHAKVSSSADNLTAVDGTPDGSTVILNDSDYDLDGWYVLDENGTIDVTVGESTVKVRKVDTSVDNVTISNDGLTITPKKSADGYFANATYFALIYQATVDLTIERNDISDDTEFIYHITGNDTDLYVTVNKANPKVVIKDLPVGEYTVNEENAWSWRYDSAASNKKYNVSSANNKITLEGKIKNKSWFSKVVNKLNDFVDADS